ncbi:integrase core domain-containing protein [Caproiciproducens sp. AGMB10547]|uniref:Integrase core domain-containing protein n=1 Tax=Caproiciproducens faecalis TaxID=2820301 RepID=A0ABS7DLF2_9FIRM|nr:integrase core domain-containing protein [Caproiciproducens faecalis]
MLAPKSIKNAIHNNKYAFKLLLYFTISSPALFKIVIDLINYYNTFKSELINRFNFRTDEELAHAVSEIAYVWYNQVRPHSYNDYRTPYEARYGLNQFRQLCYKNA